MSDLYGDSHRAFQQQHETVRLADRLESLAHSELDEKDRGFIGAATFFFLSTVDEHGRPTVSYKGGPPGFVQVTGPSQLTFPAYDGNGMFLSLGNIASTAQVGLLFISFDSPRRLRIQGVASVAPNEGPAAVPGALYLVRVNVTHAFVNCARYIHKLESRELSRHVPDAAGRQPFPNWKRIDVIEDTLTESDRKKVRDAGGRLSIEEYSGE
jgi:predicted pyridoxine 5'-phosphate oxidase superfamily flavin-nucleotide-binding protein